MRTSVSCGMDIFELDNTVVRIHDISGDMPVVKELSFDSVKAACEAFEHMTFKGALSQFD